MKTNNPAYSDIIISQDRLWKLPLDGECHDVPSFTFNEDTTHCNDLGPAADQTDPGDTGCSTHSGVLLSEVPVSIETEIKNVVQEVMGNNADVCTDKKGICTIPRPTRDNVPVSEYKTKNFFTLAFSFLFPYGTADFFSNRKRTCSSMFDWADHILWYKDRRFALIIISSLLYTT